MKEVNENHKIDGSTHRNNANNAVIADKIYKKAPSTTRFNPLGILSLPVMCVIVSPLAFIYAHIKIYLFNAYLIVLVLSG